MSWIEKLYRTYENNLVHVADPNDEIPLLPLYHATQNAQIHVVLDDAGNFLRASVVSREDVQTIIPATEDSAGRTGATIAPHPLCDTLQYVAGDYLAWGGNPNKKKNESGYEQYIKTLHGWVDWSNDCKLRSVLDYLRKCSLITDLVEHKVLFDNGHGKLDIAWSESSEAPPIFKAIKLAKKKGQFEAFVRFSVRTSGDPQPKLWKDPELQQSWARYFSTLQRNHGTCMVTGEMTDIASNHPKYIRYPGDGAKIISSNDDKGFTYLGRFTNDKEACEVGIEVSQKAHNALRWLIARQGYRDEDQAIITWAVSGVSVPDPFADSLTLLLGGSGEESQESGNAAQEVGVLLSKRIAGYAATLGSTAEVVVMGVDSTIKGKGRMAISFYRELTGSELLERVQAWHEGCCWLQRFGKEKVFVGAPSPRDIAEAAYGIKDAKKDESKKKLRKATVERLLPCIVDGTPIPRDLVESCVRRASNRQSFEKRDNASGYGLLEWEKTLGIACALYRYQNKERSYSMSLERERNSRDYLYGRLLALADYLEGRALYVAGEKRETNAGKLMQRFAERPYSTWLTIETSLIPYKTRLRAKDHFTLTSVEKGIDEVMEMFLGDEYRCDNRLTGEFLLGYHCQRASLWREVSRGNNKNNNDAINK